MLIGIAGGSGSGKTTLATAVARALGPRQAVVIPHDDYYRDLAHLPFEERGRRNFDEPAALENERLVEDLRTLRDGQGIARPSYDFTSHTRLPRTTWTSPCPVIIVEGILVLAAEELRGLFDLTIFVDTCEAERLKRRGERDTKERGRTQASVESQFFGMTRPMHALFVEPSRRQADLVVSGDQDLCRAVANVVVRIRGLQR
jgi:uridine kinase